MPNYDELFGDLTFRPGDESRSVYSPAAYLADLLQLLGDEDGAAPAELLRRRPDIGTVPLDAEHTYAELPYLDIVNEVLERALRQGADTPDGTAPDDADAYQILRDLRYPFTLPFSLSHERLRRYLHHLGVDAADLYRLFATDADRDTVAREYLGLTPDEVTLLTTVLPDGPDLRACYQLGTDENGTDEPYSVLQDVDRFRRATLLTPAEVSELLSRNVGDVVVTLEDDRRLAYGSAGQPVPVEWFEQVNRFVRLARRTELSLTDLDLVLRACCGNEINLAALRTIAILTYLKRGLQLPLDVVVSLVAPMSADLFQRVYAGLADTSSSGDVLAGHNREYRRRLTAALSISDGELAAVVGRFRRPDEGPFDREMGPPELSLLHRLARLAGALGISIADLFDVLDALDSDPSIQRYPAFPLLIDPAVAVERVDAVLAGGDVAAGLWLMQTVFGAVSWLRASGLGGRELLGILGAGVPGARTADAELTAILDRLRGDFEPVALAPDLFGSDRFSDRAAQVIHSVAASDTGIASARDDRLLVVEPGGGRSAAYLAIAGLEVIQAADFLGLGLDERTAAKLFAGLVAAGYLEPSGELVPDRLPRAPADLRLAGDFSAYRDRLFTLIADLCAGTEGASVFPSDLAPLAELTDEQRAELYDNLVYNGYLDPDGLVLGPDFFADGSNVDAFRTDADLGDIAADVLALLADRAERFGQEPVPLDPGLFAGLGLDEAYLLDSLRFNGHVDAGGAYANPRALLALSLADFDLALEFYPHRRAVLDAMQGQLRRARAESLRMTVDDFRDIADATAAVRVVDRLDGVVLIEGRVPTGGLAFFADPGNTLALEGFTGSENDAIFDRVAAILAERRAYHLDLDALAGLGFAADQVAQLVDHLIGAGHLTETLTIPEDRLGYFATVTNCLDFTLAGLEDFRKDIFFLLHAVAVEVTAGIAEIAAALSGRAAEQRAVVYAALQDAFGIPAATVESICAAVAGGPATALELLVVPALTERTSTVDLGLLRAFRRIRGFARLAAKLGLDADEVALAFRDQNLVDRYPEPLALPAGVDRIDALLESADGTVYVFRDRNWWAYSATTYALSDGRTRTLDELSPGFGDLVRVDAAFVDTDGAEWIVGRDDADTALAFVRWRGSARWAPRAQNWGAVANAFAAPARVDAAFVDRDGRTYLFCGNQYVRYSGTDHRYADEGYPRRIGDWWENEQHTAALPAPFTGSLDAAFHGRDGRTYLFAGSQFIAIGPGADAEAQSVGSAWGRVRNNLVGAGRVDAAYTTGAVLYLHAGDQMFRYSDSLENGGVLADPGFPRRLGPDVPAAFRGGVDAAFVDAAGVLHLFKDGQTVKLTGHPGEPAGIDGPGLQPSEPEPTALRWGVLDPVLDGGAVDAAFVGLDGRTYLFSGDRYVRYSTADYSTVDSGYPRMIAGDWGGLRRVDAAFVQDGVTYLFGTADPGEGAASEAQLHVRYSTRDYTTPDPGYPRPLTDNWWNLPDDLAAPGGAFERVDAVLTGRDNRTYLFSGDRFVVFDNKRRWWSEPRTLLEHWNSLPFRRVDAAFVGADGKAYVFFEQQYVRYSDVHRTRVDDRYPARVAAFWGIVANNLARTGRVDAALVVDGYTYLFSGDQYVRYTGTAYATVDAGYPKSLTALVREPRLSNLDVTLDRVDAAYADRRNVYLFSGGRWHAVSDAAYRRYPDVGPVSCAYLEDGAILAEQQYGWHRYSALEGTTVTVTPARPRALRSVPLKFRTGLDAVLQGVDGNTYLFQGLSCFNTLLNREYPFAEEWGRARNAIYHDNRVDAAFVGTDGRTYLFSGDQFVTYPVVGEYLDAFTESGPRPIAEHWGGLDSVTLAFVRKGTTYLFEAPSPDGTARYVTYSGSDYSEPDGGGPSLAGASFWDIPERYRPAGFTAPDAVLFEGDAMLVLIGGVCLPRHETTGTWSYPRPLDRVWRGLPSPSNGQGAGLTAAFTGRDGATYFFFPGEFTRYHAGAFTAREPIRDRWGRSRNNFLAVDGAVDAAVVIRGVTYLFSGDQYARYSGPDYRYVDAAYPRPIIGNLRTEEAFANLPAAFDDELAERAATGARTLIDGVVANDRTAYLFVGGTCHVVSRAVTATNDLGVLGRIRNNLVDRQRVDAALVTTAHTYLFSGDQYVFYSGREYGHVDDGYPRPLADPLVDSLSDELGVELPPEFHDRIDAAFQDADGRTYLFSGDRYLRIEGTTAASAPVAGAWGVVRSQFRPETAIDAAFVAPTGELYAFAGSQYVRYQPGRLDTVEEGFPRPIADNWGDLPPAFERGIHGAFVLTGRTYLSRDDEYVRLTDTGRQSLISGSQARWTRPEPFRHRWSDSCDYRIADVRAICRFTELARQHPGEGGLAAFLLPGPGTHADPYRHLADLFGWDADELRWCRRHSRFLSDAPADEERFEIEFLLELTDLFAFTNRLGTGPSSLRADVWWPLYRPDPDPDAAGAALYGLLNRRLSTADRTVLERQIHDEMNVCRRDALVPAVIASSDGQFRTARDLFEWFLVDVDMGSRGRTSRVREAIAATQLYLHRYLLSLEESSTADREQIKARWKWMRSYRVWEANRKVFLYPENYLRPELRASRTPAFRALEGDLLQGEITPESVERAFKRYLDEYTEVSRLTIAGGYVYTKDRLPGGARRLVLFGRTKTDPRRYYHRRAEFGSGENASATWEPWQPVNVQIDSDQVHPVHAFGRVLVFWAVTEAVEARDPAAAKGKTQRVRICYSFHNLSKEWVPVQTLGVGATVEGAISGITLLVRPRVKEETERTSIVVSCTYTVTEPAAGTDPPKSRRAAILFELNPELYADDLLDADDPSGLTPEGVAVVTDLEAMAVATATADRVAKIFVGPVDPAGVVQFDYPTGLDALSWFSVDHKGGSFLCRPVVATGTEGTRRALAGNKDRLPQWSPVDAAVELPDGTRYFFHNADHTFATAAKDGEPGTREPIANRWSRRRTVLPRQTKVDAVLTRGRYTFVLYADQYVRFTGTPFGAIDDGYPKRIAGNEDNLPDWFTVDAAFTGRDGEEYFFSRSRGEHGRGEWVVARELDKPRGPDKHWSRKVAGFGDVDAALVTDRYTFLISGGTYLRYTHPTDSTARFHYGDPDAGYPRALAGNPDGLPTDITIDAALWLAGTAYYLDNTTGLYHEVVGSTRRSHLIYNPSSLVARDREVDAAWVADGKLYLTRGAEYVRYTLNADGSAPLVADIDYPRTLRHAVDTAFTRDEDVYLFIGGTYTRFEAGQEPGAAPEPVPIAGAWGELPRETPPPFDAALDSVSGLYLFDGDEYVEHSKAISVRRPYELAAPTFELVRLTTGTASELNRKLLSGGVAALLDLSTQETDEVAVSTEPEPGAIQVRRRMVDPGRLPTGSHLDFRSANGLYYWEIFFHVPFLIAQALNGAQRFEDARQWYEYVFDPTNPDSCWRFLPFLGIDLDELADSVAGDLGDLPRTRKTVETLVSLLEPVLSALRTLAPAARQNRGAALFTEAEEAALATVTSADTHEDIEEAITEVAAGRLTAAQKAALASVRERTAIIAGLEKQFDGLGDLDGLLREYQDNPFDPHAIADLRPVAHRRTIVMAYIDNLLDWADLLFRQYTPESVDEARMLYILAYDLLGDRPDRFGTRWLPEVESFASLEEESGELDLLGYLTGGGTLTEGGAAVNASVADRYFHIPENAAFEEYWTRVEDRLRKIRQSLNIMGISQPLPLFEPPIDPMALVRSVASGAGLDAAVAGVAVPPPAYRFAVVYRRAQELVDKLRQLGSQLLDAFERRDAEELSLLRGRQEAVILGMTRDIKQAQIRMAEEHIAELTAGQTAALDRAGHYETLIADGLSEKERAQLGLMATAAATHFASGVLRVAAAIVYALPQVKHGPFIIGVEHGGRQLGDTIDKAGEVLESLGEGFSVVGEIMGVQAQHERTEEDWELQLKTAQSDAVQIGHQLAGAGHQLAVAQREAELHDLEIAHHEAVDEFMRDKFGTAELYGWMAGRLSALYFDAYQLAYEMAMSAQRAFQFERGVPEAEASFIQPVYWESRRSGLLASERLGLDLERLGKAYLDTDARGMEITKQVSLLALDPLALLRLRESGSCEFSLTEAEFDHDFPGHYRRQVRSVTVTFVDAEGRPLWVNATLTQLSHKTVLEPDPKAVQYLLDPTGQPPATLRTDWRPSQQIALSEVDGDNNGLFELRFDDERYLPFERTGAVSTWRLQRSGRAAVPPYDVVLAIRYTAANGGEVFANAVRGMLRPYSAARFFDVAREFPTEWTAFLDSDTRELSLPLVPELFPGMSGRQIGAIYPTYEVANGASTRLVLNGNLNLSLAGGKLLPTPGLTIGADPSTPLTFVLDGDKQALQNVGLVLTYQAQAR